MANQGHGYIGRQPGESSVIVARQQYTPSVSTTDFTFGSGYTVGYIDAYLNGSRLIEGSDYNATDGSTLILTSAAQSGDVLELVAYKSFSVTDAVVGIQSAGTLIGTAQTINFIGAGNTVLDQGDGTIDVSISGSGGGGLGTAITYEDGTSSPFSYIDREVLVNENMNLIASDDSAGSSESIIVSVSPVVNVKSGVAVTVGAGKTMVIDVLQIGDL